MSSLLSANHLQHNHLILRLSYFTGSSCLPVPPPLPHQEKGRVPERGCRPGPQLHQPGQDQVCARGAAGWGPPRHTQYAPLWGPRPAERWHRESLLLTSLSFTLALKPKLKSIPDLNIIFSTHYKACNFKRNFFKQNWTFVSTSQLEQNFFLISKIFFSELWFHNCFLQVKIYLMRRIDLAH